MPALDEKVRRLFEERDLAITAKNLPEIEISQGTGQGSDFPKPIVGAKFVKSSDGQATRFGIAINLKGFGTSSISVNQAAAGVVLYFYPDFDIELAPQLLQEPKIRFMVPPVCYVEGSIALDKPFNAGAGTQNRITVDAGINNTKVKAGTKIDKDKVKELQVLKNYRYRFGGELAWGESIGPPPRSETVRLSLCRDSLRGQVAALHRGASGRLWLRRPVWTQHRAGCAWP